MASPTRWTWVWVSSGSWWWTGRPGVLRFMGSQRFGHNWATELTAGGCCGSSRVLWLWWAGATLLPCSGFSPRWLLLLRAQALGTWASVVVEHRLSCPVQCGIFPDQGLNLCPLDWQADSYPLHHQGSLVDIFERKAELDEFLPLPPAPSAESWGQGGMWPAWVLPKKLPSWLFSPLCLSAADRRADGSVLGSFPLSLITLWLLPPLLLE